MRNFFPLAGILLLTGCAGAQLARQKKDIDGLRGQVAALTSQLKEKSDAADAAKAGKADAEAGLAQAQGKLADLDGKLTIAGARIDSLDKSNKELSDSLGANQSELSGKLDGAIKEKDDLAKKLAEARRDALALEREKKIYRSARDKAEADLAKSEASLEKLKRERDVLAAQAKTFELGRQDAEVKSAAAAARRHEDLGAVADAMLKELQADRAEATESTSSFTVVLSEALLFDPGSAALSDGGAELLARVGRALKALGPRAISVEAYVDDAPVKKGLLGGFDDAWALTAARAAAVARALQEKSGLDPALLSAAGMGASRPARPNDSDENRAANRRVAIGVADPLTE